jgi:serine protease Do
MQKTSYFKLLSTLLLSLFVAGIAYGKFFPLSFADLASELKPSVVNISTTTVRKGQSMNPFGGDESFRDFFGDEFFKRFFGGRNGRGGNAQPYKSRSLGSGFIWDESGHIVTNNHVVEDADEIVVILEGDLKFDAKVIGTDPETDLALLKIDPKEAELMPVKLGNSDKLRVGDWVLAIGNPFGLGHTVTAGIISAKQRILGAGPYDDFLQTDADINPGNSGGPLFDIEGNVVGVNSAKSRSGAGIGFSIPIKITKEIVEQLMGDGHVTRGWLGVVIQEVTQELAESLELPDTSGALVSDVLEDGPADEFGIERGDVIIRFDGDIVENQKRLPYLVANRTPGSKVEVELVRDGKTVTLTVKLGERKNGVTEDEDDPKVAEFGLSVQEITPELRKHLEIQTEQGVVVTGVSPDGPAADAGLRRGDVIVEVNRQEVSDMDAYRDALLKSKGKESVLFVIMRGKTSTFVVLKNKPKED